ncbi:hypothetical protein Ccrd_015583 [Cynara cardunculus var. scolymus]|uniref:Uncharacterized protein n=1 Tax=Cynara cardunculus var. scolymus TaxID=59895 RepID=A0A103YBI9_CYNCS|nr:hypothetical protein Ccrd_015583 [Cynara cardunculus var. scolymus]
MRLFCEIMVEEKPIPRRERTYKMGSECVIIESVRKAVVQHPKQGSFWLFEPVVALALVSVVYSRRNSGNFGQSSSNKQRNCFGIGDHCIKAQKSCTWKEFMNLLMLGKIGGRIRIGTSGRFRLVVSNRFSTNNKPTTESNKNGENTYGSLTHHDSYRDLDKLDFMTAAKILFTTPPKQKKFGLDFHLDLETRRVEEAKKIKVAEGEALESNPQLLEVKERLNSLEKTVKEIMIESKNQRNIKVSDPQEGDRTQHATVEDRQKTQASNK